MYDQTFIEENFFSLLVFDINMLRNKEITEMALIDTETDVSNTFQFYTKAHGFLLNRISYAHSKL